MMNFSEWLKSERLKKGLSQKGLAKATGISFCTINYLENGSHPSFLTLSRLSRYFKVPVSILIDMVEHD